MWMQAATVGTVYQVFKMPQHGVCYVPAASYEAAVRILERNSWDKKINGDWVYAGVFATSLDVPTWMGSQ